MKTKSVVKVYGCHKCLVYLFFVLNCVLGIALGALASYLLLFKGDGIHSKARSIVLYFLVAPAVTVIIYTAVGWNSVKKKNANILMRLSAGLLSLAIAIELCGALWCFFSLQEINDQVLTYMENQFVQISRDARSENWWNAIQTKLHCCGMHGPSDYRGIQMLPYSCCGSDPNDHTKGSCTFMYQKGCSIALPHQVNQNLIILGLAALGVGFLQIPGVFITWCFANRLTKRKTRMTKEEGP